MSYKKRAIMNKNHISVVSSIFNNGIIVSFQGNILPIIVAKITGKKIIIRCNTAPSKYISNYFKYSGKV